MTSDNPMILPLTSWTCIVFCIPGGFSQEAPKWKLRLARPPPEDVMETFRRDGHVPQGILEKDGKSR